ncbi:hypothetical protein FHETE_5347 [Fusarium heterosporum]|uniref:Nuclear GTPase SLIP-GC n=1 Tax=Fusarium heterosporum TaxID=42747 RepID=A0A8H5TBF1_FUSHE|nr:hypothetical protein FHETE_5347 [Fusarium heterosporum]
MTAIYADMPIPSTEVGTPTSGSDLTTPTANRLRTPSVSVTPPSFRFRSEPQGLTAGIGNIRLSESNGHLSPSPEPRSRTGTPRARRQSGGVERHNVADEELPEDAFHSPEFQQAFRNAKQLMSNIKTVLGSSNIHNESESTMRKLHQEAGRLAVFQYPATRTVGFVGDSGVGKSSLLNSLLDIKSLARTSNNGEACTCVVTEYHYHDRETLDLHVNLFSVEELRDQLAKLLQAYRNFELLHEAETPGERQEMEDNAKVARDTFRAMFRGRMNEAFLVTSSYDEVLSQLTQWASEAMPSPLSTRYIGLSPRACSDTLMRLSSEPASRESPAIWPYIRSLRVFLNAHILSRGLILVDLPGLRDLNTARRNITERYLIECNEILAICNIGRAATDEGIQEVFELASRARLSNVGIVCTRSDDIDPEEAMRDWPGQRQRRIKQILDEIESATAEFNELEEDIRDYREGDLSDEEWQEMRSCIDKQRQASSRKNDLKFELKSFLVNTRNDIITGQLKNNYAGRVTDSRVFCVSNTMYWQNRSTNKTEAKRHLELSGILNVRKHCISIVAESQRRIATQYMKDQIPALLADIELWVQSGARTASEERRAALCQSLDDIECQLRRDFNSPSFNRITRLYKNDFTEHVYNNRNITSWSRAALTASQEWAGWHHGTYASFCRNYGNHHTAAVGGRHWNEEAMDEMVQDLESPWEELCSALQQRQSDMLSDSDTITDTAIEQLEHVDATASLAQALESRQRLFLATIENAGENFDDELRVLRIDALSGLRSSQFGRAMEPFYARCIDESGGGSHARRKAIIREAMQDESIFTRLMRDVKASFVAKSEATQTKVQEATADFLRVVEDSFDLVRSENVARESEQDPEFRLRVDEVVRTGRQTMQRVHGVI